MFSEVYIKSIFFQIQPSDTFSVIKQISCLEKNLDMRLEVISKKTETDLLVSCLCLGENAPIYTLELEQCTHHYRIQNYEI